MQIIIYKLDLVLGVHKTETRPWCGIVYPYV